jgi:hypothetical protein
VRSRKHFRDKHCIIVATLRLATGDTDVRTSIWEHHFTLSSIWDVGYRLCIAWLYTNNFAGIKLNRNYIWEYKKNNLNITDLEWPYFRLKIRKKYLSLWGASCCVTYICYINIPHKNCTYMIRKRNLTTSLLFQKISLHVSYSTAIRDTGYLQQYLQYSSYLTRSTLRLHKVELSP